MTASWNANPESDIAGYKLSYGTSSGSYTTTIDVGKVTSTVLTVADGQKYYFAVRAYNSSGFTSSYSTEVSATASSATPPPSIASLSPVAGFVGSAVTIAGANFGSTQGTSTVTFNGTTATPTSWSATSILVPVPAGATSGNVAVTVGGVSSNAVAFTVSSATPSTIAFVQQAYAGPPSASTVTVTLPQTQTAGNLNVLVVGWNDATRTVQSLSDSKGNAYVRAVGPTVLTGTETQSIYYAKNIAAAAAGANTVTVTFDGAANYVDVRVAEYRGLDPVNPLDGAIGTSGSALMSDSGALTTTSANGLLVGANTVTRSTTGPGTSYTSRVLTSLGDILEDRVVTATGSYHATAPVSTGSWVMQLAAFRAAGSASPPPVVVPSIASLTPATGAVGTSVTIAGSNFGSTLGTSTVAFNGTAAAPSSWSASTIVVPVPSGATTGNVVVTVGGAASNAQTFTVTASAAPSITSLTPGSGAVGTAVTIAGANFGSTKGSSTVTFNGTTATPSSWSTTSVVVPVPTGATTGNVVVTVGGVASNAKAFTVTSTAPTISSLTPISGPVGTVVTIAGSNFGSTQGTSTVRFNGTTATPSSWSATSVVVSVPTGATTGNVAVTVGGVASNGQAFTVTTPAAIAFVQTNFATPQSPTSTVTVPFTGAQTAGDLNVIVVGWSDSTNTLQSVKDTKGNVYVSAVGPTILSGKLTQSIYYAKNILSASAGANSVTVTFSGAAIYSDVRIAEYQGIDPSNPFDGGVGATGTSLTGDSGALTTTTPNDLLVGANTVTAHTTAAGTGYTSRVITSPDGDILEDRVVAATGAYNATAPVSGGSWVMQLAAFRAAGSAGSASVMSLAMSATTSGPVPDDSSRASDYDGDAKSDLAVFTPNTGTWSLLQSSSNYANSLRIVLGTSTDLPVPGDYDGDGKADIAVYTPSTGKWTILKSSGAYASSMSTTWGAPGDLPVPGDYDGDGKTDFATYRPSTGEWLLTLSATQTTKTIVFGGSGDKPVAGDYDGDGRTDVAVFTPSTGVWNVLTSSSNYTSQLTGTIGASSDLLVPGDYDGDGRMDMAVYRPSTGAWLILGSANGYTTSRTVTLGSSADIPVPSDYDADGVTDVAVYRQATGQWSIVKSTDGSTLTSVWGSSGADVPLPLHP